MASHSHAVGSRVWVADAVEGWRKAIVSKVSDGKLVVQMEDTGEEKTCKPEDCPLQNPSTRAVEDMTTLNYLNEPGVLSNLKTRYQLDDIYTYTGSILIAVNPFASLPHLYGAHMMEQYKGLNLGELSPHVYAIADAGYRQMIKEKKSQSILVSGESGAGKTETAKLLMQYLAWMGGYTGEGADLGSGGRSIEQQVLESNPLLEAFGNAKTVRNNNSSRFGKFVELQFNKEGRISGAAVRTYLLERSRVTQVTDPERNYHIFYQLCDGAPANERESWKLAPSSTYSYLNQSSCFDLPNVHNGEEYKRTRRAMTLVGIPETEQEAVCCTVAAVLHLGNITFMEGDDPESSTVEPSNAHLQHAADLLGVDAAGLLKALTTRTRHTHDGAIISPIDVKAAENNRDALAKIIYSKLFDWLVDKINVSIGQDPAATSLIGVLDIAGFECFKENDLEQFCINFANEKLQQHFNQHVFKMEQSEYEKEEINWSYIEFVDNQDVLDLVEQKLGIMDLLDEQCKFPRATNADFATRLYQAQNVAKSARFSKPKLSQTDFTIQHYAGPVTYKTDSFLHKNRDFVVAEHQELLQTSKFEFVMHLFPSDVPADGATPGKGKAIGSGYKFQSVCSRFKKQLADLMETLHKMEPHYIRCIKPNGQNRPMLFENQNVLQQLRCGGVLEAVRISCAGYPTKLPYEDFVDHFWNLVPELLSNPDADDTGLSEGVVRKAKLEGYQLGKTKIFLRAGQMAQLDKLRTETLQNAAVIIQRFVKGYLMRKQFRRRRNAVLTLQAGGRGMLARKRARNIRQNKAATKLQSNFRGFRVRQDFLRNKRAAVRIQSAYRGFKARQLADEIRRKNAALVVQTAWRRYKAQAHFLHYRRSVVRMQCAWRCKLARRELRRRRTEAREAGKLLQDKQALEEKVKELQSILETVQNQRNDLKQQYKEERSAREQLEAKLQSMLAEHADELQRVTAEVTAELEEERAARQATHAQVKQLQAQLETASDRAAVDRTTLQVEVKSIQDKLAASERSKSELENKAQIQVKDLMNRLNNAVNQRNAAREEVLLVSEKLKKLEEDMESGRLLPAGAVPVGAAVAAAASAAAAANGQDTGMLASMRKVATNLHTQLQPALQTFQQQLSPTGTPSMRMPYEAAGTPGTPATPMTAPRPAATPSGIPSGRPRQAVDNGEPATPLEGMSDVDRKQKELFQRQQQLLREQRTQDQEKLLNTIKENLGFHKGRPVAAVLVFRSCLQWKAFQADRTTLFDKIINTMGSQLEKQQDNNDCLAYWLSNTVTLLYLLQKNIKPASGGNYTSRLRPTPNSAASGRSFFGKQGGFTSFFSRGGLMASPPPGGEASIHGGGAGGFRQVEAKYPALLFKQQLDAFVQKIFPMLRDNVKKEITPQLAACIHAPRAASTRTRRPMATPPSQQPGASQHTLSPHWGNILNVFDQLLATLKANNVPSFLVKKLFQQLFSFVNVQLFNQLLLRRECCSFSNGEYVKTGLAEVENWIHGAGKEWVGESWEELKYIRQAVTFLVIHQKHRKSLEEITNDLCPVLSVQQLYRISTMYWDDRYGTETVSHDVLSRMKQLMVDNNSAASHSFLLDDDSSIPFSLDDISSLMDDKDLYGEVPVPPMLKETKSFEFLHRDLKMALAG